MSFCQGGEKTWHLPCPADPTLGVAFGEVLLLPQQAHEMALLIARLEVEMEFSPDKVNQ